MTHSNVPEEHPIVFFDGYCGLCDGFVSFALKYDKNRTLKFSPIQGKTAKNYLPESTIQKTNTIIFANESGLLEKSDAVLGIFLKMGSFWKLMGVLYIFPVEFRDWTYDFIAAHRHQWFGKRESCRIPTKEERGVFLD